MVDGGIFTNIFTLIDDRIIKVVMTKTGSLISVIEPLLLSAFTFYLLFLFWSYWNALVEDTIVDLGKKIVSWLVVLGFALNISNYNENIVPMVMGFGDFLSHKFSGVDTHVSSNLDELLMIIITGIQETFNEAEGSSATVVAVVTIFLVSVSSIIFLVISAGFILLAKVFSGLLVIVGPIFISLALFPATRQFFSAWLSQVVHYIFLTFFIQILMVLFIEFMMSALGKGYIDLVRGFNIVIGAGIFFVILVRLPDLAAGLAGGITTGGFTQTVKGSKDFFKGRDRIG